MCSIWNTTSFHPKLIRYFAVLFLPRQNELFWVLLSFFGSIIKFSDYYIRHHLANGDSSQNEVERCQSFVGDAICDGGDLVWEYKKPYQDLSDHDIETMSVEELQKNELERMKYNAFQVV